MRTAPAALAFALALALAAAPASAQWRTQPMTVWLEGPRTVVSGELGGPAGADLLVLDESSSAAKLLPHRALLAAQASGFSFTPLFRPVAFRAGRLAEGGADGLADVARVRAAHAIEVAFGDVPGTVVPVSAVGVGANDGVAFVHLLPREADVLVFPNNPSDGTYAAFTARDFDPVHATTAVWPIAPAVRLSLMSSVGVDVAGLRLSPVARANGIDDVALLGLGGLVLAVHQELPASPDLAAVRLSGPIEVGGNRGIYGGTDVPPWFPPTVPRRGDTLGVAVLDVDLDGDLDLVLAQSILVADATGAPLQAKVVWAEGAGDDLQRLVDFGTPALTPWHDLGLELGLTRPTIVRQVSVGGADGVATWDYDAQQVVVVWNDGGVQRVWRAPAPGRRATDILQVDLVGSPAPDLAVVIQNGAGPGAVHVYPDLGEPGPVLGWAAGSPGTPARGVPHTVAVKLDPAGAATVAVEWMVGLPTTAPVGTGLAHEFPPDCSMPPPPLVVVARGTDEHGVFSELVTGPLPLARLEPAVSLRGATPPGRLVLPPGGTTAVLDGVAATGCGAASWIDAWPAGASVSDASGPTWLARTVVLPEAAYPALLADPALAVSLATSDPGVQRPVAVLPLAIDASGLVEVTQRSDRTALGPGELAIVRTTVRSRVGVALPSVRVRTVLSGLEPAGAPAVSGATVLSSDVGGAEVVLDVLPPAGAEVTIDLPVRALGEARGAAGVEARSAGDWLLTAPARPGGEAGPLPGCGCGAGSGPGGLVAALALVLARRRRRAT